jgi:hypothetical protein
VALDAALFEVAKPVLHARTLGFRVAVAAAVVRDPGGQAEILMQVFLGLPWALTTPPAGARRVRVRTFFTSSRARFARRRPRPACGPPGPPGFALRAGGRGTTG